MLGAMRSQFDKAYYDRYYRNPETRAISPTAVGRQAEFISAYLKHLTIPVKRVLDLGCGVGNLLRALGKSFPAAELTGVEVSDYLCSHYGWTKASVVDYDGPEADLVVCNDVLSYLSNRDCERAIANIADKTISAAFLGILTTEDLDLIDKARTDPKQKTRGTTWYRNRLSAYFINVGGGLYLRKPLSVPVWTLDRVD